MTISSDKCEVLGTSVYAEMARATGGYIERLERQILDLKDENEALLKALDPFSAIIERFPEGPYQSDNAFLSLVTVDRYLPSAITFGDLRRAQHKRKKEID